MKIKYNLAMKFFTETKNYEQLKFAYNEIEEFLNTYTLFEFYYHIDLRTFTKKLNGTLQSNANNGLDLSLDFEDLNALLNKIKSEITDNIFINGNYNYALFKYALNSVSYQEIIHDKPKIFIKEDNYYRIYEENTILHYIIMMLLSLLLIIGHYYAYFRNPLKFKR